MERKGSRSDDDIDASHLSHYGPRVGQRWKRCHSQWQGKGQGNLCHFRRRVSQDGRGVITNWKVRGQG